MTDTQRGPGPDDHDMDPETGCGRRVETVDGQLTTADRASVARLVADVASADGAVPLSEDARLAVAHGRPGSTHLVIRRPQARPDDQTAADIDRPADPNTGSVVGYAYAGPIDAAGARSAELCVAPSARRQGLGTALIAAAAAGVPERLTIWAHGDLPAARALAGTLGFTAIRELRLLQVDLAEAVRAAGLVDGHDAADMTNAVHRVDPVDAVDAVDGAGEVRLPGGAVLRTFRPGEDDEAWLALNAAAFAHHPEQGSWTRRDLAERMIEPWFDPAGFFLAERDGRLVGFHWTKVHPAGGAIDPDRPVGEIYVLGVDPEQGGRGLGRALAVAGLRYLSRVGHSEQSAGPDRTRPAQQPRLRPRTAILYVDGDNVPALRLYAALGFRPRTVDVLYERRESG